MFYCLFINSFLGKTEGNWAIDIDNRVNAAIEHARNTGLVKSGDRIVVVTGSVATSGSTNTMQIFTLVDEHSKLQIVGSANKNAEAGIQEGLAGLSMTETEEDLDSAEDLRLIQRARSRPSRFSVMLSTSKGGYGGINDIRVPL